MLLRARSTQILFGVFISCASGAGQAAFARADPSYPRMTFSFMKSLRNLPSGS